MEIYKQIRKMRLNGMSQRQIAATLHISRNTVKKYWDGDSVPWERKDYSREASVLTEDVVVYRAATGERTSREEPGSIRSAYLSGRRCPAD